VCPNICISVRCSLVDTWLMLLANLYEIWKAIHSWNKCLRSFCIIQSWFGLSCTATRNRNRVERYNERWPTVSCSGQIACGNQLVEGHYYLQMHVWVGLTAWILVVLMTRRLIYITRSAEYSLSWRDDSHLLNENILHLSWKRAAYFRYYQLQGVGLWAVPISELVDLILPSLRWSACRPSLFRVAVSFRGIL
jgi:hypothetical protein